MQLNLTADWKVWDNTEQVTYTSVRAAGNATDVIDVAKRRAPLWKEMAPSGGVYTSQDLVWLIPVVKLAALFSDGRTPKPADLVTDLDANVWTVLQVAPLGALKSFWRLISCNLALAYDLRDLVDVQRAGVTYDAAGGAVRHWPDGNVAGVSAGGSVLYSQIPARVQLLTQAEADERGMRGFKAAYAVIVGQQMSIVRADRLKWVSGGVTTYLDVGGIHNPARIDELPVLDATVPV